MPIAPDMITTVLAAGGRSRRFGQDKAAFELDGRPMIERMLELAACVSERVLVGLPPESPEEPEFWQAMRQQHEVVIDSPAGVGAIGCLNAALAVASTPWLMLLAVDLPGLQCTHLQHLASRASPAGGHPVVATGSSGLAEPLIALYPVSMAGAVSRRVQEKRYSLNGIVRSVAATMVALPDEAVHNMNRPVDIPRRPTP